MRCEVLGFKDTKAGKLVCIVRAVDKPDLIGEVLSWRDGPIQRGEIVTLKTHVRASGGRLVVVPYVA